MIRVSRRAGVGGLLLLGTTLCSSAGAITVSQYVTDVVNAHPRVSQRIHQYRQVVEDRVIANKGWRPIVDLDASIGKYSTRSPITGQQRRDYDSSRAALTLTQNLYNGLDTTWQLKQTEVRARSALFRTYDEAHNVALEAIQAYLDVLRHRRLVALARENVESHQRILGQIRERNDSGVGRRSELEQTEGRLARARASLVAQQNNLQDALSGLHFSLGRYIDADELEEFEAPPLPQAALTELTDRALAEHPAIRVALLNIEAARYDYRRSQRTDRPQIDLQLQKLVGNDLNGYDGATDEHSAVVNFRYNLYNGGADRATQRQKISVVHERDEIADEVRRQVIETLRLSWMAGQALQEQLAYLDDHVDKARQTVDSYREEFFIGQRDLIDLLDAESEQNSALTSRANAYYDALAASFRIYEAIGQLFESVGLEAEVSDNDLHIGSLRAAGTDTLPLDPDEDADGEIDLADHCENSLSETAVDPYGCESQPEAEFGVTTIKVGETHVEQVNFEFDRAVLTEESRSRIEGIVGALAKVPDGLITLSAHTDDRGSETYNQKLSERRAEAVKQLLVEGGIDAVRIVAVGRGEGEPIADNTTEEGRLQNRRVEFLVEKH